MIAIQNDFKISQISKYIILGISTFFSTFIFSNDDYTFTNARIQNLQKRLHSIIREAENLRKNDTQYRKKFEALISKGEKIKQMRNEEIRNMQLQHKKKMAAIEKKKTKAFGELGKLQNQLNLIEQTRRLNTSQRNFGKPHQVHKSHICHSLTHKSSSKDPILAEINTKQNLINRVSQEQRNRELYKKRPLSDRKATAAKTFLALENIHDLYFSILEISKNPIQDYKTKILKSEMANKEIILRNGIIGFLSSLAQKESPADYFPKEMNLAKLKRVITTMRDQHEKLISLELKYREKHERGVNRLPQMHHMTSKNTYSKILKWLDQRFDENGGTSKSEKAPPAKKRVLVPVL